MQWRSCTCRASSSLRSIVPECCRPLAAPSIVIVRQRRATSYKTGKQRDYYQILGVPRDANQVAIKKAFYEKSKQLHPDRDASPTATAAFLELKLAYDTLRRPADRSLYDHRASANERYQQTVRERNAYYAGVRPDYYGGGGDWRYTFRGNPNAKSSSDGGAENISESELFKRREAQWRLIMKWTIIGSVLVIIYNTGYLIQLRYREYQLAQLIECDEIAKCFLRQAEFRDRMSDEAEVHNIGALLKRDVDAAHRRRSEELMQTKNTAEIREEYRWLRAVEDAGLYKRYRERKRMDMVPKQETTVAAVAEEHRPILTVLTTPQPPVLPIDMVEDTLKECKQCCGH